MRSLLSPLLTILISQTIHHLKTHSQKDYLPCPLRLIQAKSARLAVHARKLSVSRCTVSAFHKASSVEMTVDASTAKTLQASKILLAVLSKESRKVAQEAVGYQKNAATVASPIA